MPQLSHDGLRLAYADVGAGVPLVLQHGLGGDAAQTRRHAPHDCRLITLECRGHGASPLGPEEALGFATYAGDLDALLGHLDLSGLVVGGISMGAAVALTLAERHPDRVRALVLVRPAWLDAGWPPGLGVFRELVGWLREPDPDAAQARFTATSAEYRRIQALSPSAARSLVGQFSRQRAREHVAVLEQLPADHPPLPVPRGGPVVPTLVLAAHHDPLHPFAVATALRDRIPGAVLHEIPSKDAGTAAHEAAVQAAIARFLHDLEPASAPRPGAAT